MPMENHETAAGDNYLKRCNSQPLDSTTSYHEFAPATRESYASNVAVLKPSKEVNESSSPHISMSSTVQAVGNNNSAPARVSLSEGATVTVGRDQMEQTSRKRWAPPSPDKAVQQTSFRDVEQTSRKRWEPPSPDKSVQQTSIPKFCRLTVPLWVTSSTNRSLFSKSTFHMSELCQFLCLNSFFFHHSTSLIM